VFGPALAPSAQAKDVITRLEVCGTSQCRTIADLTTLEIFMTEIGDESVAAPARAPFYTMRPEKTRDWLSTWPRYVYVPSSSSVRVTMGNGDRYWDRVGLSADLLERATRDLNPIGLRRHGALPTFRSASAASPIAFRGGRGSRQEDSPRLSYR
jgi:hypothetical protein